MADRVDSEAGEEVDERLNDGFINQNNRVQEWMAHAHDDVLDVSCVHFHEEFRRHHDELLEALWQEVCILIKKKLTKNFFLHH